MFQLRASRIDAKTTYVEMESNFFGCEISRICIDVKCSSQNIRKPKTNLFMFELIEHLHSIIEEFAPYQSLIGHDGQRIYMKW